MLCQSLKADSSQYACPALEELGSEYPDATPTFDFDGPYINAFHQSLGTLPLEGSCIQYTSNGKLIPGWLQRADAMKLYEMAYFVRGEILELGCYHGLSTSIMARALQDAGKASLIESVDLTPSYTVAMMKNLQHQELHRFVRVTCGDAVKYVQGCAAVKRQFSFVFVDHSHAYAPVFEVCERLSEVVADGGFCCFHDFNDFRNGDAESEDYRVYQAVLNGLDPACFQFAGVFGCMATFRRSATT